MKMVLLVHMFYGHVSCSIVQPLEKNVLKLVVTEQFPKSTKIFHLLKCVIPGILDLLCVSCLFVCVG